jgi:hypothetical protein
MEFLRYDEMPTNMAEKVVADYKAKSENWIINKLTFSYKNHILIQIPITWRCINCKKTHKTFHIIHPKESLYH